MDTSYKLSKLTQQQIKSIKDLYLSGIKPKEISKRLDIKYESVKYYVYGSRTTKKVKKVHNSNHNKNSRTSYHRRKEQDWYVWKADCLICSYQRRHKKHNKPYTYITLRKEYAEILKTKTHCEYCGTKLTKKNFSSDHKIPMTRDGDTNAENLAYCCKQCNSAKGALSHEEFKDLLKLISKWEDNGSHLLSRLRSAGYLFGRGRK